MRNLNQLPKAHLHLHFTGSMRVSTLIELAENAGIRIPVALTDNQALHVPADQRGWFRFQRSYDAARNVVRTESAMRRIVREAAEDDAREGSRRLELQIDPTSYATFVGGITPALEIVLDEARIASRNIGIEIGIIVAASRMKHPLDARTLARLAVKYAGDQPGEVIGFGLSNDERHGDTSHWEPAFAIAAKGGLALVPHAGELRGADHIRQVVASLHPQRLGHGVRAAEDPWLLDALVSQNIAFEVCPASNVQLGIYANEGQVPLRTLLNHGAQVALGADDPLLFLRRLTDQYEIARSQGLTDGELAELARSSILASRASSSSKNSWLKQIDLWLSNPA